MEAARQSQQAGREGDGDRLRQFQRTVARAAMATAPEEWSDELEGQIVRAGWDLEAVAARVRQAQEGDGESVDLLSDLGGTNTAIQARSWSQVKAVEAANPK